MKVYNVKLYKKQDGTFRNIRFDGVVFDGNNIPGRVFIQSLKKTPHGYRLEAYVADDMKLDIFASETPIVLQPISSVFAQKQDDPFFGDYNAFDEIVKGIVSVRSTVPLNTSRYKELSSQLRYLYAAKALIEKNRPEIEESYAKEKQRQDEVLKEFFGE